MEIDNNETIECETKSKESEERTLRSSAERSRLSIAAAQAQLAKSHATSSSTESIVHLEDGVHLLHSSSQASRSDAQSVYNFDQYTSEAAVTKRGRGRPRKDARSPVHVQHRKMIRGRGRRKKEESPSKSVQQPKIFPGRPRARARKIHRHLFPPSSSHEIKPNTTKKDDEGICDARESAISGDACSESAASVISEVSQGTEWFKIHCSLCNLAENSCLGQGPLKVFKPDKSKQDLSPGKSSDIPEEKQLKLLEEQKEHLKLPFRKTKSYKPVQESVRSRQKPLPELHKTAGVQDAAAELSAIGFDNPPDMNHVFETSGETYVHANCASWSEGVKSDDFEDVNKAILEGMCQKCSSCGKYGATVKCNIVECDHLYHYPCAIVSGVLKNPRSGKIACYSHAEAVGEFGITCAACKAVNNLSDLLFCTVCTRYYHGNCLDPAVDVTSIVRAGWQCIECKRCQVCRLSEDESKMLVCETCDKGYHTFCLKPTVATVPKSGWKCYTCRLCGDCGARTPGSGPSSRWHLNYTICDSCYQQRNKGIACPLCGKAYRQLSQRKGMRQCCVCRKYIHAECDPRPDEAMNPLEYVCPICVNPVEQLDDVLGNCSAEPAPPKAKVHDSSISPPEVFLSSSRDSFTSENENYPSSAESDSTTEMANGKFVMKGRAKTAEFRKRKKTPKMKMKPFSLPFHEFKEYKTEDDDPSAENRMVLASASDDFVLCQDLCVMCGSYGKGDEGRLIACSQCGQCYHSYCASIKVTVVVLKKGWRCLDCTVCEGCGKPHDESRLLLCDECDISFHIYCLDPPLTEVPPGNWKCKWCVVCVKCGARSPGYKCNWQANYTLCGPCASFTVCPLCSENYKENDLITQCSQCQRWTHGKCDQILDEESAEKCADYGYLCVMCRPADEPPPHLLPPPLPPTPEPEPVLEPPSPPVKVKEIDNPVKVKPPIQFYIDGVCLSESGLQHIKSLTPEMPKKIPRPRRPRQPLFGPPLTAGNQSSVKYSLHSFSSLEGFDLPSHTKTLGTESIPDVKSEPETKADANDGCRAASADYQKDAFIDDIEKKKRPKRKIQKLGIGGFVVKPRRSSSTKEISGDIEPIVESGQMHSAESHQIVSTESSELHVQEKPKRRRKPKKKTPLDESFPSYLRDAFFGKDLLLTCKKSGSSWEFTSQDDVSMDSSNTNMDKTTFKDVPANSVQQPSSIPTTSESASKATIPEVLPAPPSNKEPIIEPENAASQDVKTTMTSLSGQGNLISMLNPSGDPLDSSNDCRSKAGSKIKEETILTFDNESSKDIPSLGESTGLPQMDSKDVEDVIEDALRDQSTSQTSQIKTKVGNRMSGFLSDASNSPVSLSHPQQSSPFTLQRSTAQMHTQSSPVHHENTPSLHHQDSNSSWSESESSDQTQMSKSTMKWEADETLGLLSTISPVLYANINCPHLKFEFPNWSDRVKQIAKIWRSLPSEKRQPYLQKARENRAASRTQKTNADLDRTPKESKSQELDQEKQWKQFQALRQLQQQKQQRILQEQRAQALVKAQSDKFQITPTFAELDSSLQPGPSRTLSDMSQMPKPGLIHETDSCQKEVIYEKLYAKKWVSEPLVSKTEDLSGPHSLPQPTQFVQAEPDLAVAHRPPLLRRPPLTSPFIQVSRVRPPVDPSHMPIGDNTVMLQDCPGNLSPAEQYNASQPILSPRGLPPPTHNRMPYSPTSPVARQSLIISQTEMKGVCAAPLQKEILYTPLSTPRPQSSDSFFQSTVPSRAQFLTSVESQSCLTSHKPPNAAPFQPGSIDVGMYNVPTNSGQYPTEIKSVKDMPSSKPFYSPQSSAGSNKPSNTARMSVTQTGIVESSKGKSPVPNLVPTEHFMRQQPLPVSPINQNLPKGVMHYKDDIYRSMPGTPRPAPIPRQECVMPQPSLEHMLKENPDPNKLMAHHQLKELLQKQQVNKQNEVLELRSKETSLSFQQWPKGTYTPLQFMSKDDCFRQPLPPGMRIRNPSVVKDSKLDSASDILTGSDLKLDLLHIDEIPKDEKKCILQTSGTNVPLTLSSVPQNDAQHQTCPNMSKPMENEAVNISIDESKQKTHDVAFVESSGGKDVNEVTSILNEGSKQQPNFVSDPKIIDPSPGHGKKRKTTAGDLVKDLESQPENDAITSDCNMDALTGDVGELELDDDELLGLGNDFNILEYADPELDKGLVGEGEKSNILDEHLDLDDKDELEDVGEDDEIKSQANSVEKDLIPADVTSDDKGLLAVEVSDMQKSSEAHPKQSNLHDDFLDFEKKDESNEFKNIEHDISEKNMRTSVDPVKKETKVSFSSCSLSSVSFCAPDDMHLKAEVATVKDLQVPSQSPMSFSSPIQSMGPQESAPTLTIGAPNYRVTNVVRQNMNLPSAPHFQQPALVAPQRNIFPLHVGVSMRPNVPVMQPGIIPSPNQSGRPLLLQEQPLLLEDLVEQEKREQMRHTQEGLISPHGDALLSDIDFERLKDDVFSGPPDDSLGGPGSLLGTHEPLKPVMQTAAPTSSAPSHNFGPPPYSLICQNQERNVPCAGPPRGPAIMQTVQTRRAPIPNVIASLGLPHGIVLHGQPPIRAVQPHKTPPVAGNASGPFVPNFLTAPPSPPVVDPHTEQEKQKILQYEKFLVQQQTVLSNQQKYFETEVIKLRKIKKALNAKQRQLRKNGSELSENDAVELARISQEQATLQKQLDQIRKQSRQHSLALQDYRLKQQKRQQQQQQQQQQKFPQSPVHASVSSLQSSPQSSHSPHQMGQGAPPSPMLPSSPMGPSPSRIQHSPSPLMQHSAVSPHASTVVQQQSPLVHPHLLPQVHFQLPRPEGKTWCNPIQISQLSDTGQQGERLIPRDSTEKVLNKPLNSSAVTSDKPDHGFIECKPKLEHDVCAKRFPDSSDRSVALPKTEEQNTSKLQKDETIQASEIKTDVSQDPEVPVAKSIFAQSLPSSVTNTLSFTLRQTGMPTVCLPTADHASAEDSSQINYRGLPPAKKLQATGEQSMSDARLPKSELCSENKFPSESQSLIRDAGSESSKNEAMFSCREQGTLGQIRKPSESPSVALGRSVDQTVFEFDVPGSSGKRVMNSAEDSNISSGSVDRGIEALREDEISTVEKNETSCSDTSRTDSNEPPVQESSESLLSIQPHFQSSDLTSSKIAGMKNVKLETKDGVEQSHFKAGQVADAEVKRETPRGDDKCQQSGASLLDIENNNEGSSDEELENLSKRSIGESELEQGKQNVLLKQLLQNCPSAESSRKSEGRTEVKKEDVKTSEVDYDGNDLGDKKVDGGGDPKKKPSYLDIRRAQLEKEPTPPPGEARPKAPKRKRPKKKKPDGKDGSPVKKKCQKSSVSKSDEGHGTPLDSLMNQLTNLPPLRILEPSIKPNFNILPVSGAGDLNAKENQLKGTYGNAVLPNHSDCYSYYPYGKEHAPPILALPPSPPYRGFYSQEFPPVPPPKAKSEVSTFTRSYQALEADRTFRDIDSPDTIISSSSPECCMFEPLCKWPELVLSDGVEQESEPKKSYSPVIPIIAPIPVRLTPYTVNELSTVCYFDKEKDKENIPRTESKIPGLKISNYSTPLKDSGNVAVTLTLSSAAAENICGVLSRLADLLKVPIPATYEIVERTTTPPSQKLGLYRKSKSAEINIHSLLNGKPRFCRHCDIVVLSAGIRKKASDLACISKEEQEEEDEVIFCSTNCYMQFALTHQSSGSALEDKEAAAVVTYQGENGSKLDECKSTTKPSDDEDLSAEDSAHTILMDDLMKNENIGIDDSSKPGLDQSDESTVLVGIPMEITDDADINMADESTQVKTEISIDEPMTLVLSTVTEMQELKEEIIMDVQPRRWKSLKYKYYSTFAFLPSYKPNKEEPTEKTKPFYHTIKPSQMPKDGRRCIFCHVVGDGDTNGAARLLNMDVDKWVHLNCALWSAEVYETVNGALMNVELAYKRSVMLACSSCNKQGASLKCFKVRCANIYHFTCAMKEGCVFFKDKTLLCSHHAHKGSLENELESVAVYRRVYIDRDEHKQVASMIQGDQYVMRIGSLVFLNIGQLLPQQMQAFHTPNCIYPVGYKVIRMYWSMRKLGKRCQYICTINEVNGKPEFHIQVKEVDQKDIILKDKSAKGLWQKVLYPIEKMRRQAKTIKIFPDFISGDDLFGFTEPAILRIVESLPGVDTLQDYNFRYGRSPFLELPLAINPTGCARSEPKLRTHVKRSHTLHTSNTTRSSFHSSFGGIEISSPYVKQFVHSKSSQYRKMKIDWRNNVYLARSRIQGLGLYAARDLERHTMVIEYIGQLIRNEIAERNEAVYDAQNRGIYMFRLDENRVIDATLSGGLARYMNHSCNPNCVAEVVQIDRENKILIIANRRISRGEELSYDYKFEVEDDQHKIPCLCKAPNCRKWMN